MTGQWIAALVVVALAAWVAEAFLRPSVGMTMQPDGTYEELIEAKEAIYRAMIDLELDHKLQKVSDEDYAVMRRQHEAEAVDIIKRLDASVTDRTDILEQEIAEVRRRLRSPE